MRYAALCATLAALTLTGCDDRDTIGLYVPYGDELYYTKAQRTKQIGLPDLVASLELKDGKSFKIAGTEAVVASTKNAVVENRGRITWCGRVYIVVWSGQDIHELRNRYCSDK